MADNKEKQQVIGTSDMPPVETLNYDITYQVSNIFLNDLKLTIKDIAYADAKRYFDFLAYYNYVLPIAVLNEFLKMLANLPFKYVAPLFQVIQNKDLFAKYFIDITPKPETKAEQVNLNEEAKAELRAKVEKQLKDAVENNDSKEVKNA